MKFKRAIAEWLLEDILDEDYALGQREGFRVGAANAKSAYMNHVIKNVSDMANNSNAKTREGINLVLTFLLDLKENSHDINVRPIEDQHPSYSGVYSQP